jgi:hypothetical protein
LRIISTPHNEKGGHENAAIMRKFTQIFSRKNRAADDSESLAKSSQRPGPEFHQLSSSRLLLYNSGARASAKTAATSLVVADDSDLYSVCETCDYIDFPRVFDWHPGESRPWIELSHTLRPQRRARDARDEASDLDENGESLQPRMAPRHDADDDRVCPYCLFFRTLLGEPAAADNTGKFIPYLRIRQAWERFGGSDKDELGSQVLIEVTSRHKTLPWGYVVRSAEDDGDWEAYSSAVGQPALMRGRAVTPLLNPALVRVWIDFCRDHHHDTPGCARQAPLVPGLRLIDCETRCIVSAEDIGDPNIEYVTLSYVWGEDGQTEAALNLSQGIEESQMLPDILPRLIADAVSITLDTGFRFLWVDRYCFFRNLSEQQKRTQIKLMGEIYAQSALTLVAAGARGINDGIHGLSIPRQPQLSLKMETGHFTTTLLRPDHEVASSPWGSRAWTLQEGLLARRRLIFTPSQAYFQCRSLHCHETLSLPLSLAPNLNLGRVFPEHGAGISPGHLENQIRDFISRDLSRPSERLDAFRGILHHYSNLPLAVDHFQGLPLFHPGSFSPERIVSQTDRLAVGLGWMPHHSVPSARGYVDPYVLDEESWDSDGSLFPSWTWLAWKLRPGQVALNHSFSFNLLEDAVAIMPSQSVSSNISQTTAGAKSLGSVRAPPRMEISVGFADGALLSWEIDGDAINTKSDRITHLHLKTYCFDLRVQKDPLPEPGQVMRTSADGSDEEEYIGLTIEYPNLSKLNKVTIRSWLREGVPEGVHGLVGVLLYGRHWRSGNAPIINGDGNADHSHANGDTKGASTTSSKGASATNSKGNAGGKSAASNIGNVATALICARTDWRPEGRLRRLGILSISFKDFTPVDETEALMQGIPMDGGWVGNLPVQLREVDIY